MAAFGSGSLGSHFRYGSYVIRECCRIGIPWRGLIHDLSKFYPSEWFPYVRHFYGDKASRNERAEEAFDVARIHHRRRNPHHWEYWCLLRNDGGVKVLPMPEVYRREMLADWIGAGKVMGKPDTVAWYRENRERLRYAERFPSASGQQKRKNGLD